MKPIKNERGRTENLKRDEYLPIPARNRIFETQITNNLADIYQ